MIKWKENRIVAQLCLCSFIIYRKGIFRLTITDFPLSCLLSSLFQIFKSFFFDLMFIFLHIKMLNIIEKIIPSETLHKGNEITINEYFFKTLTDRLTIRRESFFMLCHLNKTQFLLFTSNSHYLMHHIRADQRRVCNLWQKTCIQRNT